MKVKAGLSKYALPNRDIFTALLPDTVLQIAIPRDNVRVHA
jgi:hypothetical protein